MGGFKVLYVGNDSRKHFHKLFSLVLNICVVLKLGLLTLDVMDEGAWCLHNVQVMQFTVPLSLLRSRSMFRSRIHFLTVFSLAVYLLVGLLVGSDFFFFGGGSASDIFDAAGRLLLIVTNLSIVDIDYRKNGNTIGVYTLRTEALLLSQWQSRSGENVTCIILTQSCNHSAIPGKWNNRNFRSFCSVFVLF